MGRYVGDKLFSRLLTVRESHKCEAAGGEYASNINGPLSLLIVTLDSWHRSIRAHYLNYRGHLHKHIAFACFTFDNL